MNPLRNVRHKRALLGAAAVVVGAHAVLILPRLAEDRPTLRAAVEAASASPIVSLALLPARRAEPADIVSVVAPSPRIPAPVARKPRARSEEPVVVVEAGRTAGDGATIDIAPVSDAISAPPGGARGADDRPASEGSLATLAAAGAPTPGASATSATSAASAASADVSAEPPAPKATVYKTRLPAPFTLRYAMSRGNLAGTGVLSLTRDAERYEARLQGSVGGLPILGWTSTGVVDSAGFAPTRYVDHRLAKKDQAANFQRDAGKITFSGSSNEYPLVTGSQDRLSWMVQLPSVVAADRSLVKPGARVALFVVGAHGDADGWVFQCQGVEAVDTPSGNVQASRWMREPRKPYDTKVEVWLDAARHFLPVKARMTNPPSDSPLELLLVEASH